jgi:hypothetical protein
MGALERSMSHFLVSSGLADKKATVDRVEAGAQPGVDCGPVRFSA